MAKFIIEVDEGCTLCEHCPFADSEICENALWSDVGFDRDDIDLPEVLEVNINGIVLDFFPYQYLY